MDFDAARNDFVAVGSLGHVVIGRYFPNNSYEVFDWNTVSEVKLTDPANYNKIIWIDAHNEVRASVRNV